VKKQKRPKFKIKTFGKLYRLEDSPLYKLTTKRKLAELLQTNILHLKYLENDSLHYNAYEEINKKGKKRCIEQPSIELDKIHTRIASLICRINIPDFVHSGRTGHSHITNASAHLGSHKVLTTDIKSFFPSTTQNIIFKFFHRKMKCSPDVAKLLSLICSYNEHLPTGSRISMPLALWANMDVFLDLERLAVKYSIKMTLYVDDITFSGDNLNDLFIVSVKRIVKRYGHNIHPNKTKLYSKNDPKLITGVILQNEKLLVKNEQHKNIYQDLEQWKILKDTQYIPESLKNRLLGRLISLSAIEPKYKEKARSIRNYSSTESLKT
jgi:hypothetical protein